MLIVERFYGDKISVVGAHDETKKCFVFKRPGTVSHEGKRAYLLDSWVFRVWLGCNRSVKDIYIKDTESKENHKMSVEAMRDKGQIIEGGEVGKDFAVFVEDLAPKPEVNTLMPRAGKPKPMEIFDCLED